MPHISVQPFEGHPGRRDGQQHACAQGGMFSRKHLRRAQNLCCTFQSMLDVSRELTQASSPYAHILVHVKVRDGLIRRAFALLAVILWSDTTNNGRGSRKPRQQRSKKVPTGPNQLGDKNKQESNNQRQFSCLCERARAVE